MIPDKIIKKELKKQLFLQYLKANIVKILFSILVCSSVIIGIIYANISYFTSDDYTSVLNDDVDNYVIDGTILGKDKTERSEYILHIKTKDNRYKKSKVSEQTFFTHNIKDHIKITGKRSNIDIEFSDKCTNNIFGIIFLNIILLLLGYLISFKFIDILKNIKNNYLEKKKIINEFY